MGILLVFGLAQHIMIWGEMASGMTCASGQVTSSPQDWHGFTQE